LSQTISMRERHLTIVILERKVWKLPLMSMFIAAAVAPRLCGTAETTPKGA